MASKRITTLKYLIKCIEHDFGFYNPIWKWDSLPESIKDNYKLIENDLLIWKNKGYIDLFTSEEILYIKIIKIPELE